MSNDKRSLLRPSIGTVAMIVALVALFTALATQATPCANAAQCNVGDTETFTNDTTFEAEINVGATPGPGTAGDVIVSAGADTPPEWTTPVIMKTATETLNTSATFQDDDELTFPVAINTRYTLDGVLLVGTNTTPNFKFQFTVPTGTTIDGAYMDQSTGQWVLLAEATSNAITGINDYQILFSASIQTSGTAGSVTLQWAQNTSDAGNTQVEAGSWLRKM